MKKVEIQVDEATQTAFVFLRSTDFTEDDARLTKSGEWEPVPELSTAKDRHYIDVDIYSNGLAENES